MAQIWMDDENAGVHMHPSASKALRLPINGSALKHSAKKTVLGKLDNVMHNKQAATPFRSGVLKSNAITNSAKPSLCTDTLRKQQRKQNFKDAQQVLEERLRPPQSTPTETMERVNLFDYMDFPNEHSGFNRDERVTEIWSRDQTFSDGLIAQIIHGKFDEEIKIDHHPPIIFEDEFDDVDVYATNFQNYSADINSDAEVENSPSMPDFSKVNFDISF